MPLFAGYEQQDVQEFLAFLLDAVHEDLNRVPNADRKYVEAKEAKEGEPEEKVAMEAWKGYLEVCICMYGMVCMYVCRTGVPGVALIVVCTISPPSSVSVILYAIQYVVR